MPNNEKRSMRVNSYLERLHRIRSGMESVAILLEDMRSCARDDDVDGFERCRSRALSDLDCGLRRIRTLLCLLGFDADLIEVAQMLAFDSDSMEENKEKKRIYLSGDPRSVDMLYMFCNRQGISVNQFVLNCIASKLEEKGEHFFWVNHKEENE